MGFNPPGGMAIRREAAGHNQAVVACALLAITPVAIA
jgi:hypothetical protein